MKQEDLNLIYDFLKIENQGEKEVTLDLAFNLIYKIERMAEEGYIGKASGKGCFGSFTMFGTNRARIDYYWDETRYGTFEASNRSPVMAIMEVVIEYIKWYNSMQESISNESKRWKTKFLKK